MIRLLPIHGFHMQVIDTNTTNIQRQPNTTHLSDLPLLFETTCSPELTLNGSIKEQVHIVATYFCQILQNQTLLPLSPLARQFFNVPQLCEYSSIQELIDFASISN